MLVYHQLVNAPPPGLYGEIICTPPFPSPSSPNTTKTAIYKAVIGSAINQAKEDGWRKKGGGVLEEVRGRGGKKEWERGGS